MSEFEIYKGKDKGEQCWRWKLLDHDNSSDINIARSEEAFVKSSIKRSIKTIQSKVGTQTPILLRGDEQGNGVYRFEYFQSDNDNKWYWMLRATNNEPMAIGGEGFSDEQSVIKNIENVRKEIGKAEVSFKDKEDDPSHEAKTQDTTEENASIPPGS